MLNRIAKETTIHGVEESWRANWVGRVFFVTVFACSYVLMGFQLKGLFHAYISEAVGTRVTSTTKFDTIEIPSIYYCNKNWLPKSEALWHYQPIINHDSSLNTSYHSIYKECVHMARYNMSFDPPLIKDANNAFQYIHIAHNQYCKPFFAHWRSMIKQELVNAVLRPLEDGNFDYRDRLHEHRLRRPELSVLTRTLAASVLADPIQALLNNELSRSLKATVEKSVRNVPLDDESDDNTKSVTKYPSSSSVLMSIVYDPNEGDKTDGNLVYYLNHFLFLSGGPNVTARVLKLFGGDHTFDYYGILSRSTVQPSAVHASLDGVCWEYPTGPQYLNTKQAVGRKHKHFVIHMGGLVHQLRTLSSRIASAYDSNASLSSNFNRSFKAVMGYPIMLDDSYHTHFAVSKQKEPGLHFHQKTRVDSRVLVVDVKYWKKSYKHLNTKSWPCEPAPWTELDQAHCNQRLSGDRQEEVLCKTYLPASRNYQETAVTSNTCIYDHTGIFKDISSALSDLTYKNITFKQSANLARQLSNFRPSRVTDVHRRDVISRLTEETADCPKPCSRTTFNYQTSYPSSTIGQAVAAQECRSALAYWLTPKTFPRSLLHSQTWFVEALEHLFSSRPLLLFGNRMRTYCGTRGNN